MSINDRDLGIIGAGAFLTVLCLLINWPFVFRIVIGLLILVVFMIVALMRVGPDRVTLEEFMARRFRSSIRPRRFSYRGQGTGPASAAPQGVVFTQPASAADRSCAGHDRDARSGGRAVRPGFQADRICLGRGRGLSIGHGLAGSDRPLFHLLAHPGRHPGARPLDELPVQGSLGRSP